MRPSSFADFNGQSPVLEMLRVAVAAAKVRRKPLAHVLLAGPPGCGKTTLGASVLPSELGVACKTVVCSAIEKPQDLLPTITTMRGGEVLFLDEIHALPRVLHETLYTVLEDSKLSIVVGEDKDRQALTVELPVFTIIGATTREGLLSEPLRDRFRHRAKLELYSDAEMLKVLEWCAAHQSDGLHWPAGALRDLVPACHGTARHAMWLIDACADTAMASGKKVTFESVVATLARLGIDNHSGLNKQELALLRRLQAAPRQTLGLASLGAMLDEEEHTVENVFEPWLLQRGYIIRAPTGRTLTKLGQDALAASNL